MNSTKFLSGLFKRSLPILSILTYVLVFAVVFNTFNLTIEVALYNILLSLPVFALCLIITRRYHIATIAASVIAFALFYIDQFVFSARLTHIRFSDLKLADQAFRVVNRYSPVWNMEITRRLTIAVALCSLLIFLFRYYKPKYRLTTAFLAGIGLFAVSSGIILSGVLPSSTEEFDFSTVAESRGLLYSWYCQQRESSLKAPDGYRKAEAERILAQYQASDGVSDVNIIVIMNESLADYDLIGNPRFQDPLPFIHGLYKNSFKGRLAVSVFGGNTATTEYEFLTGNTMAFLPEAESPYLQYVNNTTENLTSDLGELGYGKTAVHPYYSEEWNRSQVYRFFGFDRFISGKDFGSDVVGNSKSATSTVINSKFSFGDGPLYVRGLISDQTSYERVLEEICERSFIFNVTMQNHGGYDYRGEDFSNTEYVTEADRQGWEGRRGLVSMLYGFNIDDKIEEEASVNQYLTLSNLSDQAFAYLLGELEKSDQKTIVLMFGDHQPGLMIPEHYVDCEESPDLDYIVPYILWANYDIEFDAPEYTSPNYLSAILKKNAGLPLTAWDQFRLDVMQEYPVVTANFILDKDGKPVGRDDLKDYELVQYMRMFDS